MGLNVNTLKDNLNNAFENNINLNYVDPSNPTLEEGKNNARIAASNFANAILDYAQNAEIRSNVTFLIPAPTPPGPTPDPSANINLTVEILGPTRVAFEQAMQAAFLQNYNATTPISGMAPIEAAIKGLIITFVTFSANQVSAGGVTLPGSLSIPSDFDKEGPSVSESIDRIAQSIHSCFINSSFSGGATNAAMGSIASGPYNSNLK